MPAGMMQRDQPVTPEMLPARRAAQYVRMSTDHQKYSTENQAEVIETYARSRGLEIVRTYADEGLSGLGIGWRDGLKTLIADVENRAANFECILVYDVSRWGRFQDVDESAYYEFICKRAGIAVHYCADEFENDGSLASVILKNVKRVGAADYSKQLSKKVFLGQSRMTKMGFWRAGPPAYGLRRQLVDETGAIRMQLEYGQRKYIQTDRVKIVHGPEKEVGAVRRMFNSFVMERKTPGVIARELNADNVPTAQGRAWSDRTVRSILMNEMYTGSVIFNQTSFKLKQKRTANPREMWVRCDCAFPAVVSVELFAKAQAIFGERRRHLSDQEAINRLAALGREKGGLTTAIISAADDILTPESYRRRFGSLMTAYELAGYQMEAEQRRFQTQAHYRALLAELALKAEQKIVEFGGHARFEPESEVLYVNDVCRISLGTARASTDGVGYVGWKICADRTIDSDLTLIARMNVTNENVTSYYLFPTAELRASTAKHVRMTDPVVRLACRFVNLEAFCQLCADSGLGTAA